GGGLGGRGGGGADRAGGKDRRGTAGGTAGAGNHRRRRGAAGSSMRGPPERWGALRRAWVPGTADGRGEPDRRRWPRLLGSHVDGRDPPFFTCARQPPAPGTPTGGVVRRPAPGRVTGHVL